MKTIYCASVPDGNDGRTSDSVGSFFDQSDAKAAAAAGNPWGHTSGNVNAVTVYESFDEWITHSRSFPAQLARKRRAEDNRESDPEGYAQYLELQKRFGD